MVLWLFPPTESSRILRVMMRSMAVINQKGGVGKTTTTVNVAAALAQLGRRVLLIDLDPQAHATLHLGVDGGSVEKTIYHVLVEGTALSEAEVPVRDRLTIVPAHVDLVGAEVELTDGEVRERVLRDAMQGLDERYDVCMIDCPPSLGILTVNALAATREVLIPLQAHFLGLQGLGALLETVSLVRGVLNPELRVAGVILCMYEKVTRLAQEVRDDILSFIAAATPDDAWYGAKLFDTHVRRNVKLAECPSFGKTIFEYEPSCNGAEDYLALAGEVHRLGKHRAALDPVSKPADEVTGESGALRPAIGDSSEARREPRVPRGDAVSP